MSTHDLADEREEVRTTTTMTTGPRQPRREEDRERGRAARTQDEGGEEMALTSTCFSLMGSIPSEKERGFERAARSYCAYYLLHLKCL